MPSLPVGSRAFARVYSATSQAGADVAAGRPVRSSFLPRYVCAVAEDVPVCSLLLCEVEITGPLDADGGLPFVVIRQLS